MKNNGVDGHRMFLICCSSALIAFPDGSLATYIPHKNKQNKKINRKINNINSKMNHFYQILQLRAEYTWFTPNKNTMPKKTSKSMLQKNKITSFQQTEHLEIECYIN